MSVFKDHFSSQAAQYRAARPSYPPRLFEVLAAHAPARECAWDAGCGNGQASVALAGHFQRVMASDPSAEQIANAQPHERVQYTVAAAEHSGLDAGSMDLVTVAQALHWFDVDAFHAEVRRVLKPGGIIAEWGYGECSVSVEVDAVFQVLYEDVLGAYWPAERRHIENAYADLAFPFETVAVPPLEMQTRWTLSHYLGYLASWSALQRFRREQGSNPLDGMRARFGAAWGEPGAERVVRWRLFTRVGRHG